MNIKEFDKYINEQIQKCLDILISKGKEYDNDPSDRLQDFKQAGKLQNTNQVKALFGMLSKQLVSLGNFCTQGDVIDYPIQKWEERITDSINYLLILSAMLKEEFNNRINTMLKDEK